MQAVATLHFPMKAAVVITDRNRGGIVRLLETFLEDFRKELNEIQSRIARRLFILAKLTHLTHLRVGEYVVLTGAADLAGHHGVGLLLES